MFHFQFFPLHCHTLIGVRSDLDEEGVVLDVVTHLQHSMWHKLGEAKAKLVRVFHSARSAEVWPIWVRDERLYNVDGRVAVRVLVQQGERYSVFERPFED